MKTFTVLARFTPDGSLLLVGYYQARMEVGALRQGIESASSQTENIYSIVAVPRIEGEQHSDTLARANAVLRGETV